MKVLRVGYRGTDVRRWQLFLRGQNLDPGPADGVFGPATEDATKLFQLKYKLIADGIAGDKTLGQAMVVGFSVLDARDWNDENGPHWPPEPHFQALTSTAARQSVFGKFSFVHEPLADNPENIRITDGWAKDNVVKVHVPQLAGVRGAPKSGNVYFHRMAAQPVQLLFDRWESEGLLRHLQTWAGSFVPRYIRGSRTVLSNHAFGTAFDINAAWNGLGVTPALRNSPGSVRELVTIANELGFYWGGHFKRRPDGMHFELAVIR